MEQDQPSQARQAPLRIPPSPVLSGIVFPCDCVNVIAGLGFDTLEPRVLLASSPIILMATDAVAPGTSFSVNGTGMTPASVQVAIALEPANGVSPRLRRPMRFIPPSPKPTPTAPMANSSPPRCLRQPLRACMTYGSRTPADGAAPTCSTRPGRCISRNIRPTTE